MPSLSYKKLGARGSTVQRSTVVREGQTSALRRASAIIVHISDIAMGSGISGLTPKNWRSALHFCWKEAMVCRRGCLFGAGDAAPPRLLENSPLKTPLNI